MLPTGARALPAPAWRRAGRGCRICASPRKRTRFPTSNFFSCLHLLIRFCTSYCKAVLTVTPAPMLTSTSAGNRPQVFYLSAGRGVINYQFSHKKKKKLKQSAKRTPQIAGQKQLCSPYNLLLPQAIRADLYWQSVLAGFKHSNIYICLCHFFNPSLN